MQLSILDQSPISAGETAKDALKSSVELAKLGEALGFQRYWIAEHHDLFGLACPNPDVMLGVIGSHTQSIKIGAGAVLLPYYKPFRVAETYNLLATLFPRRIDLGIGRAPGGPAEVSMALSDNYLEQVKHYSKDIDQLIDFLHNRFSDDHMFKKITPTPVPNTPPHVWLLGTSEKSAILAAEKGVSYSFGHFMTDTNGPKVVQTYREQFYSNIQTFPYVIVAIHVICAETTKAAHELALSYCLWNIQQEKNVSNVTIPSITEAKQYTFTREEKEKIQQMKEKMIIGNPEEVKEKMLNIQTAYAADELMIITITHDLEKKFHSYRLVAEQFK